MMSDDTHPDLQAARALVAADDQREGTWPRELRFYHGTSRANAEAILLDGFQLETPRDFSCLGRGVYVGRPDKALRFARKKNAGTAGTRAGCWRCSSRSHAPSLLTVMIKGGRPRATMPAAPILPRVRATWSGASPTPPPADRSGAWSYQSTRRRNTTWRQRSGSGLRSQKRCWHRSEPRCRRWHAWRPSPPGHRRRGRGHRRHRKRR